MLCIGVATVLGQALPLQRSYWVPLTVAVVLKPDFGRRSPARCKARPAP